MFNTTCTNKLKCHNGTRYCTSSKHAPHHKLSCDKPATHGRVGTKDREYCKECMNQLIRFQKLVGEYVKTNTKCIDQACTIDDPKQVVYGFRGQSPTHCKAHSESNIQLINLKAGKSCSMLDSDSNYCCKMQGTKLVGTKYYCTKHATTMSDQVNLDVVSTKSMCVVDGCDSQAGYALDSNTESTKATHCKKCADGTKEPYHYTRTRKNCKTCMSNQIEKRATFGLTKGDPLYCDKCVEDKGADYWDVVNKQCITCSAKNPVVHKRAYFHNGTTLDYCFDCNPDKQKILDERSQLAKNNPKSPKDKNPVVKVKSEHSRPNWQDYCPKCPEEETASAKMYGWAADGRKMFCKAHKEDGMINVISNRCDFDLGPDDTEEKSDTVSDSNGALPEPRLCGKIAQYGAERAHRCADHKEDFNRIVNACKQVGCNDRRAYGYRDRETGKGKMQYCGQHKEDNMIDISHRLCQHLTDSKFLCDSRASFPEVQDGQEMFCTSHNINKHHDVTHKKCSELVEGIRCHVRATYGYTGKGNGHRGKPEKCFNHRGDRINVVIDRCIRCFFGTQDQSVDNRNLRGHMCSVCYRMENPDELARFNRKENIIRKSIKNHPLIKSIPDVNELIIYDKAVGNGCSRRPDILIKLSSHSVIVEIDEHQHNRECYSDDDARIIEIQYALESKPLIVIRFNPDGYTTATGRKNALLNQMTGKIVRVDPYNDAINELVNNIYSAINSIPVTPIKTIYLRYTPDSIKKKTP